MNSFIYSGGLNRAASNQTFAQYRAAEFSHQAGRAVNEEGGLLDYETLELRVHPPNVEVKVVDNESVVTIDSANRPGTLIEVVQCLTELGLEFTRARITSDGGWFVDEFAVVDGDGPVTDSKKLAAIKRVLNVNFEPEDDTANPDTSKVCTVIELVGRDAEHLLTNVVDVLTRNGCAVWSAAAWTWRGRAAFVLGVHDPAKHLQEKVKLQAISQSLRDQLGGPQVLPHVNVTEVANHGHIHHERRLHALLIQDDEWQYEEEYKQWMSSMNRSSDDVFAFSAVQEAEVDHSVATPSVVVTYSVARKYWFVQVKCPDRGKLLFDTVCTFVDLDFDVWHASLDLGRNSEGLMMANLEFYVRPRLGVNDWQPEKGEQLRALLTTALVRRMPTGLKLHVQTHEELDVRTFTKMLVDHRLKITRAKVKPSRVTKGLAEHTLFVTTHEGEIPPVGVVEAACKASGGTLAGQPASHSHEANMTGMKFSFSCIERNWRKEWGIGSGCSISSGASDDTGHKS